MICEICGKEFKPSSSKQTRCRGCTEKIYERYQQANRMKEAGTWTAQPVRHCVVCGKEIPEGAFSKSITCCIPCSYIAKSVQTTIRNRAYRNRAYRKRMRREPARPEPPKKKRVSRLDGHIRAARELGISYGLFMSPLYQEERQKFDALGVQL